MLVTPGTKAWPCGHLHPVPWGGGGGGQVVWILMVVSPIMQEQCPNCGRVVWAVIMSYHWRKSAEHSATRGLPSEILPARTRWYASTYGEGELNFGIHMAQ